MTKSRFESHGFYWYVGGPEVFADDVYLPTVAECSSTVCGPVNISLPRKPEQIVIYAREGRKLKPCGCIDIRKSPGRWLPFVVCRGHRS